MDMDYKKISSKDFGTVLKGAFREHDLSQRDISLETGIPLNSLNRKLNGGIFDLEELMRIASVLGTPLSELISRAEKKSRMARHDLTA
ncbi:helix-turn-helix domain-containing protein [Bifidobacterium moukalabense]|uniref:helix-turn-helix domain-containing protein n=1 Tax=Bifidobacterium moukalabense TaxID=1333651 RepID=UPI00201D33FC|nr:helix-turn-helix transcriptional regulator [Bifidobacterium moukalabense]